ncbi:DNA-directed RNA polymerase I subunit RPA43 [Lampris incognitus]|uniref:DNA-directed RNA polymerase I subunit RPA43 n=1 Tax=Lampris incognitus TaxID=2546036 RepID=UPI0024B60A79|nr:DNA-directed RNA polymerase I subunit RPA43 [Lampris incognitus]
MDESKAPRREPEPSLIPTFAEASRLVSAPYSCLVVAAHRRHVALPPMYVKKKKTGIQEQLNTELLRYSERLQGVPLAFDCIKLLSGHGAIYDDNGYIHIDIEVNFVVFQPSRGKELMGKVNKIGVSHVGCLVHGCFNASIPKPSLVSVETWRDAAPKMGTDLKFEVLQIDADAAGVLLIRGQLDRTRVQELLAIGESLESSVPTDHLQPPGAESSPDNTSKKKKKKKDKCKVKDEEFIIPTYQPDSCATLELNGSAGDANSENVDEKRKEKKKKEKQPKEETEEVELSLMEVHTSDSSGYHSDRLRKKRKKETGSDERCLNDDSAIPKSKKKRKSEIQQFA